MVPFSFSVGHHACIMQLLVARIAHPGVGTVATDRDLALWTVCIIRAAVDGGVLIGEK